MRVGIRSLLLTAHVVIYLTYNVLEVGTLWFRVGRGKYRERNVYDRFDSKGPPVYSVSDTFVFLISSAHNLMRVTVLHISTTCAD